MVSGAAVGGLAVVGCVADDERHLAPQLVRADSALDARRVEAGAAHRDHVLESVGDVALEADVLGDLFEIVARRGGVTRSITMWTASPIGIGGPWPITSAASNVATSAASGPRARSRLEAVSISRSVAAAALERARRLDPASSRSATAGVDLGSSVTGAPRRRLDRGALEVVGVDAARRARVVDRAALATSVPSRCFAFTRPTTHGIE